MGLFPLCFSPCKPLACGLRCGVSWVRDICLVPGKIQDGWWQTSAAGLGGWMSLAELPRYHCSDHTKLQGNTERNKVSRPWKVLGLSRSWSYQLYTSLQGVQGTCSKSTCKGLKQLAERLKVPVLGPGQPTEFCKQHFIKATEKEGGGVLSSPFPEGSVSDR